jgi:ABC-type protease/lipase transport system fused ATPase/permease subunit
MDWVAIYQEGGMVLVVGIMFVYLVVSMSKKSESQQKTLEDLKVENRGQSETLENMEGMIIKLIERWNKSDDTSLRHREDILRETSDLAEKISYLSGRINGNSK